MKRFKVILWLVCSLFSTVSLSSDLSFLDARFTDSVHTGLLLTTPQGQVLAEKDAQHFRTPASTTKLLTAYLALQHWGRDYHFKTQFYLRNMPSGAPWLVVKGLGDPFLVSETLASLSQQLAQTLRAQHIEHLGGVVLDTSYYVQNPTLPGSSGSNNPYDALPSAITANFNTVNVVQVDGKIASAESQTPLTPIAIQLAKTIKGGLTTTPERLNTGASRQTGERNFAELLRAFMQQQGVSVAATVLWQTTTSQDRLLYEYVNPLTLAEMVAPMMRYSTNFIANQLALNLSAEKYGPPASPEKVAQFYAQALAELGWHNARIEDGAGLSASNRLTPAQLVDLLIKFEPYRDLLPEIEPQVFAKSGTLIGVSTLAGYIQKQDHWLPFALMMDQKTPYHYRNLVATQLRDSLR